VFAGFKNGKPIHREVVEEAMDEIVVEF